MSDESLGLFFENYTHLKAIWPELAYETRRNEYQIREFADMLYPKDVGLSIHGTGRSGMAGKRWKSNWVYGLNRLAWFSDEGSHPMPREGDALGPVDIRMGLPCPTQ